MRARATVGAALALAFTLTGTPVKADSVKPPANVDYSRALSCLESVLRTSVYEMTLAQKRGKQGPTANAENLDTLIKAFHAIVRWERKKLNNPDDLDVSNLRDVTNRLRQKGFFKPGDVLEQIYATSVAETNACQAML